MRMSNVRTRPASRRPTRTLRVSIPRTRDPFVNTPLISLGPDASGEERFWISTWNSCVGALALVVSESSKARAYRFKGKRYGGFYSAAQEDADTLWLCGDLSRVVRLTLSTGAFEEYPTGAPSALVFQGMVLDRASGLLFAAAFPWAQTTAAFSFDYRGRRGRKVLTDISPAHYMRFHFPNGDGSYSCVMHCPGESLLRWDPRADTVDTFEYKSQLDTEVLSGGTTYHLIADDQGRRYFPGQGWYEPAARAFSADGPRPRREMTWFARRGRRAWGADYENGAVEVAVWDLDTGAVRPLCSIPDSQLHNLTLSASGKVMCVNMYGEFFRYDGDTGALEVIAPPARGLLGHGRLPPPDRPRPAARHALHHPALLGGQPAHRERKGLRPSRARLRRGPPDVGLAREGLHGGLHRRRTGGVRSRPTGGFPREPSRGGRSAARHAARGRRGGWPPHLLRVQHGVRNARVRAHLL